MDHEKHPGREIIAGTVGANNPRDASHAFASFRAMRPDIKKPCVHFAIGYAPEDGDRVRTHPELRREIANRMVSELIEREYLHRAQESRDAGREPPPRPDPNAYAWLMVTHHEKGHVHDHVVLCRIGADRTLWVGKNEARSARVIAREVESTFGLREIDRPGQTLRERQHNPQHTHPKNDRERAVLRRTGKPVLRAQVAARIRGWIADHEGKHTGISSLQSAMARHGITVIERHDAYGQLRGHTIEAKGQQWTASQLGFRGRDTLAAALERCTQSVSHDSEWTQDVDR